MAKMTFGAGGGQVYGAAATAARAAIDKTTTPEAVAGLGGAAGAGGAGNWLSKLLGGGKAAKFVGGNWAWLAPLLITMIAQSQMGKFHQLGMSGLETEHLGRMKELTGPEDMYYRAMMPQVGQENQMLQMALLQQLMNQGGPTLAPGEEIIGGGGGGGAGRGGF